MRRKSSGSAPAERVTTEYVMILAAVAIVGLVAYVTLGTTMAMVVNDLVRCLEQTRRCG
jgi:hypothetical protein